MNAAAWADILSDDDSDPMLLAWADWLEDQGDEACRGVRELLVGEGKRPDVYKGIGVVTWWQKPPSGEEFEKTGLPAGVFNHLRSGKRDPPRGNDTLIARNYQCSHAEMAVTRCLALHDAATAYVRSRRRKRA
jgi:hypothetical protein